METEHSRGENLRPCDENLPQVLGLYAPFRSFGREKTDMDMNQDPARSSRKRKRKISSISSYLEPATFVVHPEVGDDDGDHTKAPGLHVLDADLDGSASRSFDDSPHSLAIKSISREKVNKVYERRPRHKTRESRYEVNQVKEAKKRKKKDENMPKKDRKRKRKCKEKSGATLMHNFTAQNVAHNRLTLRSEPTLGLFSKGRASLPVKRRGLPDLAFSELTFLNPDREGLNNPTMSNASKLPHKDKAADSGANISRYFTSTKSKNHNERVPGLKPTVGLHESPGKRDHPRHGDRRPKSKARDPSLPLVELLENPFLGFGSSGTYATSPARQIGSTVNATPGAASTQSTDYVSWSASGAPSHHSPQRHHSDKTSKSPIHVERSRPSTTDVQINISEIQRINSDPRQETAKKNTCQECSRRILNSRDPILESDVGNRSTQILHQPISGPANRQSSPKNASKNSHGSSKESEPRPVPLDDKCDVGSIEKEEIEIPYLLVPDTPDGISPEQSPKLFDAELDSFLQKFKPIQAQSEHDLARQSPIHCAQSQAPNVINQEQATNLENATDNLSATAANHVNTGVDNSLSRRDSTNASGIPSTQALEARTGHTSRSSWQELHSPARQRSRGSVRKKCESGYTEVPSEHTIPSNPSDHFPRNAWSGYNNIYQQQTERRTCDLRNKQKLERLSIPADAEARVIPLAFHHPVNEIHNNLDGHVGPKNIESYSLIEDRERLAYHGDNYHVESAVSARDNIDELIDQSALTSGTELDAPWYPCERHHSNNVPSGGFLGPEDGWPSLPNHDLDTLASDNSDRYLYKDGPDERYRLKGCQRLDVRPRLRTQNGTCDLGDSRRMALIQQHDDELLGFWKPHKRN
ncbi:hypothetical protein MMC07_007603 [Pseudocyphellaria aurata]|nr:hypothetical protein [Pseudocyphellaria aurata]